MAPTTTLPVLLPTTIIRSIAGGARVAVSDGPGKVAILYRAGDPELGACTWTIEDADEDGRCYYDCGAPMVEFANGWACEAGHEHLSFTEYYDAEEVGYLRNNGYSLAANARLMDGSPIR